jgi:hypothetical protein
LNEYILFLKHKTVCTSKDIKDFLLLKHKVHILSDYNCKPGAFPVFVTEINLRKSIKCNHWGLELPELWQVCRLQCLELR